jgi:transcriptional regulator with XRE-family HTH domain
LKGAKRARTEAGFTLRIAAKELRVSLVSLWRWENGKHFPPVGKIQEMAELYGVPAGRIMKEPKPTRYETRKSETGAAGKERQVSAAQGEIQNE